MSSYICTCKNPDSFLFSFSIIIWVSRSPKRVNLQLKTIRGKIFPYAERNPRASVHPVACLGKPNAETPGPFTPVWLLEIFALWSYLGRRYVPRGWRQEEGCTQRAPKGRPPPPRLPREGMVTTARMGGSGPPRTRLARGGHHAEKLLPDTTAEQQLPPSLRWGPRSSRRSSALGMHMSNAANDYPEKQPQRGTGYYRGISNLNPFFMSPSLCFNYHKSNINLEGIQSYHSQAERKFTFAVSDRAGCRLQSDIFNTWVAKKY